MRYIIKDSLGEEYQNDNYESLFLNFLYDKTNLFTKKNSPTSNVLIPETLRELQNSVHYLDKVSNDDFRIIDYFFSSVEIIIKKDDQREFFYDLEKIPKEYFNKYFLDSFLRILTNDFDKELIEDLGDFDNITSKKIKRQNISLGDVLSVFQFLEDYSHSNLDNYNFISLSRVYYSLRIMDVNPFENQEHRILLGTFLVNELNQKDPFPSFQNRKSRSRVELKDFQGYLSRSEFDKNLEHLYWLTFFVSHIGAETTKIENDNRGKSYKYRESDEYYGNKTIINSKISNVVFSWFSFIYKSLEPLPNNFDQDDNELTDFELYNDLIRWNRKLKDRPESKLLWNIEFIQVFFEEWHKAILSIMKGKENSYEESIYTFFFTAIPMAFENIKNDYDISIGEPNIILENPVIKYWAKHRSSLKIFINDISPGSSTAYNKNILKDISEKNLKYYSNRFNYDSDLSQRKQKGTKQAMTNMINKFNSYPAEQKELWKYRNEMNKDFNSGLRKIEDYLKTLANG